jgi:hypothetical protein
MGYVIIKYFDVSEDLEDYKVLDTERLRVKNGDHIFHPRTFEGYENTPYTEPPIPNPDICDDGFKSPERNPVPLGIQRVTISPTKGFGYVEFYYKKVK